MQAILKSKHQRFTDLIKNMEVKFLLVNDLVRLEKELQFLYYDYLQKREELRHLIELYNDQKKTIQHEMKRIKKAEIFEKRIAISFPVKNIMSSNSLDL